MKTFLIIGMIAATVASCTQAPERIRFGANGQSNNSNPDNPNNPDGDPEDTESTEVVSPNALAFTTAFPRLTKLQWENSVRDVLLLDAQPNLSSLFPADPSNTIFGNDGNSLIVSDGLWTSYQQAAESMADRIGSNQALANKLIPESAKALSGDAKIIAIIKPLALRAFKRPATDAQINRLVAIYKNGKTLTAKTDETIAGIQAVVGMLLEAPQFLYRMEIGESQDELAELNAYDIASRLSYSAWNSIPDEALFKAAENGSLLTDEGLAEQAKRLMNDPKADEILMQFYRTIFGTATYADTEKKDPSIVKSWPDTMGKTLVTEADMFIREAVVKEKGGINQLLTATYAFVNADTAPIYKVDVPAGKDFVKVNLNPKERVGILTQIGSLARRAQAKDSNAIRRGVLVSDKLLCVDVVSSIPPMIPELEKTDNSMMTAREIVTKTSGAGTCGGACHAEYINPSGFAFENYDAAGNWRTMDNGKPVDAASSVRFTTGLVPFNGPQDFIKKIIESKDLHQCLAQKAVNLIFARKVDKQDQTLINNIAMKSKENVPTRDIFVELLTDSRIKLRGQKKAEE